jgi:hypothetical protein
MIQQKPDYFGVVYDVSISSLGQLARRARQNPRSPRPEIILNDVNMINNHLGFATQFLQFILL